MPRLSLADIDALAGAVLLASGADAANAAPVADSIREAEAEGIRNVGLAYLPTYCEHLRCGKVDGRARPTWSTPAPGVVAVDAAHGFCHPAFLAGFDAFVAAAERQGIAAMAITRSSSAGVVGWFVDRLARAGLVALAFANSSALMAPWGGRTRLFGTNPLGFAAPRRGGAPVVVDMATSATAWVNIRGAARRGEAIPLGWALDPQGRPTTDAEAGLAGSAAPLGGAKGSALALMVEILAAGLTNSTWSKDASAFGTNEGGPPGTGQLFVALAPGRFGGDGFLERVEALCAALLAEEGVRLPGDRRLAARRAAERDGVEVPDELLKTMGRYR